MVDTAFGFHPDPDNPGWFVRKPAGLHRFMDFYGTMHAWPIDATRACIRVYPQPVHLNGTGRIHGGFTLGLIDQCLFIGPSAVGIQRVFGGSTIDSSAQFLSPFTADKPLDTIVELMRETYKMIFVRGTIEQDGVMGASFSGTLKKASPRS